MTTAFAAYTKADRLARMRAIGERVQNAHVVTLRPPTAHLSDEEALARVEELRRVECARKDRPSPYAFRADFEEFTQDWQRMMAREN